MPSNLHQFESDTDTDIDRTISDERRLFVDQNPNTQRKRPKELSKVAKQIFKEKKRIKNIPSNRMTKCCPICKKLLPVSDIGRMYLHLATCSEHGLKNLNVEETQATILPPTPQLTEQLNRSTIPPSIPMGFTSIWIQTPQGFTNAYVPSSTLLGNPLISPSSSFQTSIPSNIPQIASFTSIPSTPSTLSSSEKKKTGPKKGKKCDAVGCATLFRDSNLYLIKLAIGDQSHIFCDLKHFNSFTNSAVKDLMRTEINYRETRNDEISTLQPSFICGTEQCKKPCSSFISLQVGKLVKNFCETGCFVEYLRVFGDKKWQKEIKKNS